MTVRILYLITELSVGGAQSMLCRLVEGLDRARFEPSIACLYNGQGRAASALRALGVPVFDAGTRHPADLAALVRLYRHICRQRPAVLHTHLFHANLPGRILGRIARVPVIINTEHTMAMESEARYRLNRWTAPLADRVIAVSASVRDFCLQHIHLPAAQVVLIRNAIGLTTGPLPGRRSARQVLNLPGDGILAGAVGRLDPAKGYDILLEALARLDGLGLVVVGEGPERGRLEAQASRLGIGARLHWLGYQEEILQILPAFDLFVQPSRHEGLPVTVLEAMAAGLPVVATAVGGTPEVVLDGETGLLVPHEDPQALASAIRSLVADPQARARMGAAGRERVRDHFSLGEMVRQTEQLYATLLAAKGLEG